MLSQTLATMRRPQTLAEARKLIASIFRRVTEPELVELHECAGRCLAQDITASIDLPPFSVAAMDGYAIRSDDLDGDGRANLNVVAEIAAGHPSRHHVGHGEAARIYTGAAVPPGVDRVVPQEFCRQNGRIVSVIARIKGKPHIRSRGEDVLAGQKVLAAGTRLEPAQLALLGALRTEKLAVLRSLRIVLLSVGDELAERGDAVIEGGIVDSNRPMLRGWLKRLGCTVEDLGIVPDSADILLKTLIDAAATADLIITSEEPLSVPPTISLR